jgi:hypothetical protein
VPPEPVREIGSEFHWESAALLGADSGGGLPEWLSPRRELFATGCGALRAVLRRLSVRRRLYLPSYFCPGVAHALSEDVAIGWYQHLPGGTGPRLDTLRAAAGDVVLAQNLFGREDGTPWQAWIRAHPEVPVIEDHSHDPFSDWARTSTAAYAVASLRKTLPLPDGGLLWSPSGLDLPVPSGEPSPGAAFKLAAMLLKSAWLAGRPIPKDAFRTLQRQGERHLLGSTGAASTLTAVSLPLLDVAGLRAASSRNVRALRAALPAGNRPWSPPAGDAAGSAPFRLQLTCDSEAVRDALLAHLARHEIFAPVHWRPEHAGISSGDEQAADLGRRMLTLPVDHRCRPYDVRRIAEVLGTFTAPARAPGEEPARVPAT